jgi:uncharacterized protein YdeI (YjbR/CyaY-like superfamily)
MPRKAIGIVEVRTRDQWRRWLEKHCDTVCQVWLVFNKRHTGVKCLSYEEAVEEALCFGWIDSIVKRLDDARYARKFTPRTAGSRWSVANRRRYERLKLRGLLAAPGLNRAPTNRRYDALRPSVSDLPAYIERAFRENPTVWKHFEQLAPSYRRAYIGWIDSAKREETKERRLREAVGLLAAGEKLGLK